MVGVLRVTKHDLDHGCLMFLSKVIVSGSGGLVEDFRRDEQSEQLSASKLDHFLEGRSRAIHSR